MGTRRPSVNQPLSSPSDDSLLWMRRRSVVILSAEYQAAVSQSVQCTLAAEKALNAGSDKNKRIAGEELLSRIPMPVGLDIFDVYAQSGIVRDLLEVGNSTSSDGSPSLQLREACLLLHAQLYHLTQQESEENYLAEETMALERRKAALEEDMQQARLWSEDREAQFKLTVNRANKTIRKHRLSSGKSNDEVEEVAESALEKWAHLD
jgi:hypothetical protein